MEALAIFLYILGLIIVLLRKYADGSGYVAIGVISMMAGIVIMIISIVNHNKEPVSSSYSGSYSGSYGGGGGSYSSANDSGDHPFIFGAPRGTEEGYSDVYKKESVKFFL